jgi:hypothetical protein
VVVVALTRRPRPVFGGILSFDPSRTVRQDEICYCSPWSKSLRKRRWLSDREYS